MQRDERRGAEGEQVTDSPGEVEQVTNSPGFSHPRPIPRRIVKPAAASSPALVLGLAIAFVAILLVGVWGVFAFLPSHHGPVPERDEVAKGRALDEAPAKTLTEVEEALRKRPPQQKWNLEKWAPVSAED